MWSSVRREIRRCGAIGALALSLVVDLRAALADPLAPGEAAPELTRQGQAHAHDGDNDLAIRRFLEALTLDPGYGPAYLELGAARMRGGDLQEAQRTYDLAIERIPNFAAAYRARAALKRRMGETEAEIEDLEMATKLAETPETLRELAGRYVETKAWPAALATWRRMSAFAEVRGDQALRHEASTKMRALQLLCAELDPVTGVSQRGWARHSLASIARHR
jgi:tetratricopeptide (TPR) repeat protein